MRGLRGLVWLVVLGACGGTVETAPTNTSLWDSGVKETGSSGSGGTVPGKGGSGGVGGAVVGSGGVGGGTVGTGGVGGATGGTGGSAGTGAAGAYCDPPLLSGEPRGLVSVPGDTRRESSPILLQSTSSAQEVILAYHWTSWPGGTVTGIRFLPMNPWGEWPAGPFEPTYPDAYSDPSTVMAFEPFGAAPAAGGRVGLLFWKAVYTQETQSSVLFDPSLDPHTGTASSAVEIGQWPGFSIETVFAAAQNDSFVVGFQHVISEPTYTHAYLEAGTFKAPGEYVELADVTGCGNARLSAAAAITGGNMLLAYNTAVLCCQCLDGLPGPATKVVVQVANAGAEKGTVLELGSVPRLVSLVPRTDGAWLLFTLGDEGNINSSLQVARVDQKGVLVTPPTSILGDVFVERPATASVPGNGLAVSWVTPQGKESQVHLAVFDESLTGNEGMFPSEFAADTTAPMAVISSVAGDQLVNAWVHPSEGTGMDGVSIHVARWTRPCPKK